MKRFLICNTFLLSFLLSFAQAGDETMAMDELWQRGDSLKNLLKTQSLTQKQELDIYQGIMGLYAGFAIDSVIAYAPQAIKLANQLNEKKIALEIYYHWGVAHSFRENYDTAVVLLDKAKQIAIELRDKKSEAEALGLIAFVYAQQGKYLTAIDYYLKVLPIHETTGSKVGVTTVLTNLGELNRKLNNTGIAIQYLDKAAEVCEEIKSSSDSGFYTWKVKHLYNEYATTYLEQGNREKALEYVRKSIGVSGFGFVINECQTQLLQAKIHLQSGDYDQALQSVEEAMVQADILKDKNLYVNTWLVLSDIYLAQQRYPEAETEALKAWQADSTNIAESRTIAMNIAMANLYMHHTEKAAYYFKKYEEINEQYSKKSFQTTMSDMAVKYETVQKEMRISDLERQKILSVSIGIFGILLAITIGVIFRQKIKNTQKEKQLIAVNAVFEGEKKERERFARDLHDGLGGMLSAIKIGLSEKEDRQIIRDKIDDCIEVIRCLARGVMPASLLRYGMKAALEDYCRSFPHVRFHFFGENKRIDEKIELVIYYSAYELVNNSVKHSGAKNINVQLIQEHNRVSLAVMDDGCGFDKESPKQGSGLKNISDRVIAFNGKMNMITFPDEGTETSIELKIGNV
jgi:signal transduction histidine kinase